MTVPSTPPVAHVGLAAALQPARQGGIKMAAARSHIDPAAGLKRAAVQPAAHLRHAGSAAVIKRQFSASAARTHETTRREAIHSRLRQIATARGTSAADVAATSAEQTRFLLAALL